jgi:hypothetical protein
VKKESEAEALLVLVLVPALLLVPRGESSACAGEVPMSFPAFHHPHTVLSPEAAAAAAAAAEAAESLPTASVT